MNPLPLSDMKNQMAPWIWNACNRYLDRVDENSCTITGPYERDEDRARPMQAALEFAKSYPPRPAERLPSSPAVDHLRAVLAEAPREPRDEQWGQEVEGMEMTVHADQEYMITYAWGPAYLERLFAALIEVIEVHGSGDAGWGGVRWEVYDKHAECFKGIRYSRGNKWRPWSDDAAQWLDGEYLTTGGGISYDVSFRSMSPLGKRYNNMLPHRTPQQVKYAGWYN